MTSSSARAAASGLSAGDGVPGGAARFGGGETSDRADSPGWSDDDDALVSSVEEVLRRECPPGADPSGERRRELWSTVGELGWPALGVPERAGGIGAAPVLSARVLEKAGAALFPAPLLSTAVATAVLARLETSGPEGDRARDDACTRIVAGAAATVAIAGRAEWDGHRLTGTLRDVMDLPHAEVLVVIGHPAGGGASLALLVDPAAGIVRTPPTIDPTRPLGTVEFAGAPAIPLGTGVNHGLDLATVLVAAELVGIAARALEIAVEHAATRTQFGRPIGAFQGVKHRLADVYVAVERARGLVYAAAETDFGPADLDATPIPVAMAKAAATEAALFATRAAIQVNGALGVTAERGLVPLLRRARQGGQLFGDARTHYTTVARALVAAGQEPSA
ncbi:acyl-CoA dehydrogenase family protein [Nocardia sp. alder85J]|uniref:acyl-CoA dehydrogenase family protein n=1 Tax=Nocardia sp. alder85J TaxID=2862949 RepID=UPI001CD71D3D|nr:acyl-CoA dehydrogenase family protein [Nocardia sp. alder85J]MCX4096828.1 acyl-CoA/acyl-ACP dehydrogenase [Nocardia sp. alder85J]